MSLFVLVSCCLSFFVSSASAATVKDSGVKDSAKPVILYSARAEQDTHIGYVKFYTSEGWQHQMNVNSDGTFTLPENVTSDEILFAVIPKIVSQSGYFSLQMVLKAPSNLSDLSVSRNQVETQYDSALYRFDGQTTIQYNRIVNDYIVDIPFDNIEIISFKIKFDSDNLAGTWTIEDLQLPEEADENQGLLGSIISFIQGIWQAIIDLPAKIGAAFQAVGQFIVDGIKSLFLPSDGFFDDYWQQLNDFFADRFGLLYFPVELLVDLVSRINQLGETEPYIQIPQLEWDGHVLISAQRYEFDFLDNETFAQIHSYYLMAMDVALIGALVALLWKKFQEVLKT